MNHSGKKCYFLTSLITVILFTVLVSITYSYSRASSFSDTISTSWPDEPAIHNIQFTVSTPIPSNGKIIIIPEHNQDYPFNIQDEFSHENMTFSINEEEKTLAEAVTATESGVQVVDGTRGEITITLADELTVDSGDQVSIKLGNENKKIVNPDEEGSYQIEAKTFNSQEELLDKGKTLIAVIKPIQVGTSPAPQVITESAVVLGREEAALRGELFSLGIFDKVDVFFEYRVKGLELEDEDYSQEETAWTETEKVEKEAPTQYSYGASGLEPGTTYEFRAVVEWVDIDTSRSQGLIKEFTTETVDHDEGEDEPGDPGDEPGDPDNEQGEGEDDPGDPDPPPPGSSRDDPGEPANPPPEDLPDPPPYMVFTGSSFLGSDITLVKDNKQIETVQNDQEGNFRFEIEEPSEETHDFMLIRKDSEGENVDQISFTAEGDPERMILISGNVFPPTIELSGTQVTEGNPVTVSGLAAPESVVEVKFSGADRNITRETTASSNGTWSMSVSKDRFAEGRYDLQARMIVSNQKSSYTDTVNLSVGETGFGSADLTADGAVNLSDFSILMHYWGTGNAEADINRDGTVDLVDFSIMMNYWTG